MPLTNALSSPIDFHGIYSCRDLYHAEGEAISQLGLAATMYLNQPLLWDAPDADVMLALDIEATFRLLDTPF